jgi:hypothetical protein
MANFAKRIVCGSENAQTVINMDIVNPMPPKMPAPKIEEILIGVICFGKNF